MEATKITVQDRRELTIVLIWEEGRLIGTRGLDAETAYRLHLLLSEACGDNDCPCFRAGCEAAHSW